MIKKVLIANRGEITCRVIKTAKKLGIKTVAVFSEADRNALHVQCADESYFLGVTLQETYLNMERLLAVAKQAQVDAIHPGYGFLAENADFALQCKKAGFIFIGPSSDVIKMMGLKDAAKDVVERLAVPTLPGYHGENQDPLFLLGEAKKIGFPVLLKAAAGGGGKGMRIVFHAEEFLERLSAAKRESFSSFNNDHILIEKYLTHPRHIEIQIAADEQGHVVHLFERDCSIQRRYQKVLEEAPASFLSEALKEKMYAAAVAIGKAIHYVGVGTIECLVQDEQFYFMEMNTRLQVEHPVTELITGQDLVEWQFRIADKQPLPLRQEEIKQTGYAIEARLCAEDPSKEYLPASGKIEYLRWPENVRVDTGVDEKESVSIHYDSLLAKIIAYGKTREHAVLALQKAIDQTEIIGIVTNRLFLKKIISLPEYQTQMNSTKFISDHADVLFQTSSVPLTVLLPLASAFLLQSRNDFSIEKQDEYSPWEHFKGFQLNQKNKITFSFYRNEAHLKITLVGDSVYQCESNYWNKPINLQSIQFVSENVISALIDGDYQQAKIINIDNKMHFFYQGEYDILQFNPDFSEGEQGADERCIRAPIPGNIVAVLVKESDVVEKGQPLLIMEAMKMEHTLSAPQAGKIHQIHFAVKDQVEEGVELITFESDVVDIVTI